MAFGDAVVTFAKIGGHGLLGLTVDACGIALGGKVIPFTSPDLERQLRGGTDECNDHRGHRNLGWRTPARL